MPIRPELRHLYSGTGWFTTRKRILARAKNSCEACGKPNGIYASWFSRSIAGRPAMWWTLIGLDDWRNNRGELEKPLNPPRFPKTARVILTIAHLNHVPGDDRDENLMALCQWCHLNYDRLHHRETRLARKDAARPIFEAGKEPAIQ
jgi:hypothetical protein